MNTNETKWTPWRVTDTRMVSAGNKKVHYRIVSGEPDFVTVHCERTTSGSSPGTLATFQQIAREHNERPELIAFAQMVLTQADGDLSPEQFRNYVRSQADKVIAKIREGK